MSNRSRKPQPWTSQFDLPDDTPIRRYRSLKNFKRFLENGLWFSHPDEFKDQLEGFPTKGTAESIREHWSDFSLDSGPSVDAADAMSEMKEEYRDYAYINCWRIEGEGEEKNLIWENYTDENGVGIAFESTVGAVRSCIEVEHLVYYGPVAYVDNEASTPLFPHTTDYFIKEPGYSWENELRIVLLYLGEDDESYSLPFLDLAGYSEELKEEYRPEVKKGRNVSVEPNELVSKIIVSPYADEEFSDEVEDICEEYDLDVNIVPSEIGDWDPSY